MGIPVCIWQRRQLYQIQSDSVTIGPVFSCGSKERYVFCDALLRATHYERFVCCSRQGFCITNISPSDKIADVRNICSTLCRRKATM